MQPSVLAVYGPSNPGKIERHVMPLAETAETTLVCIDDAEPFEGLTYRTAPSFGLRPVGLALMFVVALDEVLRRDYDGVVSFSLFPHGCIALAVGRLRGLPVHLGVLGMDLDVHARARYADIVAWLFRQFDVVSVPGTRHRRQLEALGVPPARSAVLTNAIDGSRFVPDGSADRSYDCCWVGRFGPEKYPERFVEAVARLVETGREPRAVMLGDGPLREGVRAAIHDRGLEDNVDCPGWVDDPLPYYQQSKVFVLTSRRDALPLTLVEAMATGAVPVVPAVGNVTDVAEDGQNAVVVTDPDAAAFASAIADLLDDDGRRERLAANAEAVRETYDYAAATADWNEILNAMGLRGRSVVRPRGAGADVRA